MLVSGRVGLFIFLSSWGGLFIWGRVFTCDLKSFFQNAKEKEDLSFFFLNLVPVFVLVPTPNSSKLGGMSL